MYICRLIFDSCINYVRDVLDINDIGKILFNLEKRKMIEDNFDQPALGITIEID